jgi:TolB protein
MTSLRGFWVCVALVMVFWSTAALGQRDYEYIDINNPFLRKIPIAIPFLRAPTEDANQMQLSHEAADLLSDALNFTGYFEIMDRKAFLFDPQKDEIAPPGLQFQNWTLIGAELLITGSIQASAGQLSVELRLLDTYQRRQVIGKRYTGFASDLRRVILRFCGDVVFYLTGNRGVFDTRVALVSTGTGHKEIYDCEFDGSSPQQMTHTGAITLFPAWSTDGQWLAYTSYRSGRPDLYITSMNSGEETVVAHQGININPAWVPGKFELAATLSFSGDPEIYLLTGKGKIIKRLTNMRGGDVSPTWSPDGKRLAFVSDRSGSPQVYVMDMDSGDARRLTFDGDYNTQPSWSPKGDKIAYSSMVHGRHEIVLIGLDGQGPVQLTDNAGDNEAPSWSPDGSLIAFSSTREGPSRIYVMTAIGTDQRRLLSLPGEQSNPKWSPNLTNY